LPQRQKEFPQRSTGAEHNSLENDRDKGGMRRGAQAALTVQETSSFS